MEFQIGDRVVVATDNQARKARIASINSIGRPAVTFKKGDVPLTVLPAQVFPLYRYVKVKVPKVFVDAGMPSTVEQIQMTCMKK